MPDSKLPGIDFQPFIDHEVVLFFNSGATLKGVLVNISPDGKMLILRNKSHSRPADTWDRAEGVQLTKPEIRILASAIVGYYLNEDIPASVMSPYQAAQM